MIKVIVFDFDGVLVDSNRLKREAWFKLFAPEEVSDELIMDVLEKVKATRYDILREIFMRLGKPEGEIESLVSQYAGRYNDIVQAGIFSMGLNPWAEEILSNLKPKFNLYLNSATSEEVLAVGDGQDDLNAAKTLGCRFIGFANDWNGWKNMEFSTVSNLSELKN